MSNLKIGQLLINKKNGEQKKIVALKNKLVGTEDYEQDNKTIEWFKEKELEELGWFPKIRMTFSKYQKFVSKIAKEYGFELTIDPIAMYPLSDGGDGALKYRYELSIDNKWPERFPGSRVIFLVRWYYPSGLFKGFKYFFKDERYQLTEEELRRDLEKTIEKYDLKFLLNKEQNLKKLKSK